MGRIKIILGLILFAILASTAWQIAACEFANYELKDDLKDVASLLGSRIGLATPQSDDQLYATVIRKAAGHEIVLERRQITIERSGTNESQTVLIEAKYAYRIWLPGYYLLIHFTASSE